MFYCIHIALMLQSPDLYSLFPIISKHRGISAQKSDQVVCYRSLNLLTLDQFSAFSDPPHIAGMLLWHQNEICSFVSVFFIPAGK